ncbi:MAG TPA: CPBP family intramembrane glutamic endopeptidase [Anaerolineales bacterium]
MNQQLESHTVGQTLVLHLLPGALITAFYFLTAPLVMRAGYPGLMALLLAILVILIPFELGYLLYQGYKQSGRFSLKGVVLYREPMPLWQYFIFVPLLLGWSVAAFGILVPVDDYFIGSIFSWLPDWSFPSNYLASLGQYPSSVLLITFLTGLALNGIAGPLVEELYFRGYLLPRIPASKRWAPLVNVILFSLYHFFSPWQNITRIVAIIPMVYAVSWKRNIYLSIFTHCPLNTLGMVLTLGLVTQ